MEFDLGKVAGWKYWSSEIKAETRFGGPVLTGTGGINIINTAGISPTAAGSSVTITAANLTRIIPKDLAKGDLWVGDLQIIRGVRPRVDTAVVPGARLEMIF